MYAFLHLALTNSCCNRSRFISRANKKLVMIRVKIWIFLQAAVLHVKFGHCSRQVEALFKRKAGEYLANYAFRTEKANSEFDCTLLCSRETSCVSINYKKSGENRRRCELNNKTLQDSEENRKESSEFVYFWVIKRVSIYIPLSNEPFLYNQKNTIANLHIVKFRVSLTLWAPDVPH